MSNFKSTRKKKYRALKMGIHRWLPAQKLIFLGNFSALSHWIADHSNIPFFDFPNPEFNYARRYELFQYLADNFIPSEPVDYFEFGVAQGNSFRWWIANLKHPGTRFFGFDTFTGLPEAWGPFKKGAMSNGNAPPEIDDSRHTFYQGIFQKTLYDFLDTYKSDKPKIVHLDADLYSSTLFVLTTLRPHLTPGDILIFDEFNVARHEFRAFSEWVEAFYIEYEVLAQTNNFYQVALRLT